MFLSLSIVKVDFMKVHLSVEKKAIIDSRNQRQKDDKIFSDYKSHETEKSAMCHEAWFESMYSH